MFILAQPLTNWPMGSLMTDADQNQTQTLLLLFTNKIYRTFYIQTVDKLEKCTIINTIHCLKI